jgi:hypothetical protein
LAVLGYEARLIILSDEIVEVVIRFKDDIPAAPAITPAWTALGPEFFALKSDTPPAAVTGAGVNLDFVYERRKTARLPP